MVVHHHLTVRSGVWMAHACMHKVSSTSHKRILLGSRGATLDHLKRVVEQDVQNVVGGPIDLRLWVRLKSPKGGGR